MLGLVMPHGTNFRFTDLGPGEVVPMVSLSGVQRSSANAGLSDAACSIGAAPWTITS